jgi:hypothetical protein
MALGSSARRGEKSRLATWLQTRRFSAPRNHGHEGADRIPREMFTFNASMHDLLQDGRDARDTHGHDSQLFRRDRNSV